MKLSRFSFLQVALATTLVLPPFSAAQEPAASQGSSANPSTARERKKLEKKAVQELGSQYGDWLRDEVPDIMTDAERRAFLELSTNEEREQFIEIFWRDRNPEPESPQNTVREEHYRRLAYADEHFASGIPGRKTDRGHIYIIWGPPDEIESHPTGGTYQRPVEQGGGSTSTYPWESWRYRHLEGVGENIEIEFVDPSGSGEYRLTSDPCEKDALAHVPGAGPSLGESTGMSSRSARFTNSNGTTCPMPLGGQSASLNEFDRIERGFKVMRPPARFKELETLVTANIARPQIHLDYRTDFLRVTTGTVLVPITVQVLNRELGFQDKKGLHSAVLDMYGRITTPGGVVVQTFEDLISRDFPDSLFQSSLALSSIYQKTVSLRSGLYRLDLVVKDTQNGNLGIVSAALRVPRFDDDKLDASSLILADQIQAVPAPMIGTGQFVLNSYKVRPRIGHDFSSVDQLGIFLQLYNLKLDDTSHQTSVSVVYRILKDQQEVWKAVEAPDHLHLSGEQLTIERSLPVASLVPGHYTVEVIAIDLLTNETVTRSAEFTLKAAPPAKPAPAHSPAS